MSKRTPLKAGETGYAYVFLSDPGVVLKLLGVVRRYSWSGNKLHIEIQTKSIAIASYSGSRNMVYFPGVDRCRSLDAFDGSFGNNKSEYWSIDCDGVSVLRNPQIPDAFDSNVSTLSVLRHMRMPPPVSINVKWTANHWATNASSYSCQLKCIEGDRRTNHRKQSEIDEVLESLL